jgi:hypothetical protein
MKLDQRKLSITIVLIYVICIVVSIYTLFTLQDDLVYKSQAIEIAQLSNAQPTFIKLYLVIGVTMLAGLGVLFFFFNNKGMEIIYVEKKDEKNKNKTGIEDGDKGDKSNKLDLSSIKDIMDSKVKSQEIILTNGITEICKKLEAGVGAYYMVKKDGDKKVLEMNATYAMSISDSQRPVFEFGEGLVGQVAVEQKPLIIDDIPEGYIKIVSGLGSASPTHVLLSPVKYGEELCGVIEIASFTTFSEQHIIMIDEAFQLITNKLYSKSENPKKEDLKSIEKNKKDIKKG